MASYHLMFITHIDEDGRVQWRSSCPFEPDDPKRSCLWGTEPSGPCLWEAYENDDHHPEFCNDRDLCELTTKRIDGDEVFPCWDVRPEECDSFSHPEFGHMHHESGCGLKMTLDAVGVGESVFFTPTYNPPVPIPVTMEWDYEGGVTLTPVTEGE